MAKRPTLEDQLAALNALRDDLASDRTRDALCKALASKTGLVVGKAALIVGEFELGALEDELAAAFDDWLGRPGDKDKGCRAKAGLAEALYRVEHADAERWRRGIVLRQIEPVYGGRVDTAVELRGWCGLGLVRMNDPGVMIDLADLLADPEPAARAMAAKAVAYSERPDGLPLLRLRVAAGEEDPETLTECLAGMLKLDADASLGFVAHRLDDASEEAAECAAMALGQSRSEAAFGVLRDWHDRTLDASARRTAFLAIAMLRHEEPNAFLLAQIAHGPAASARMSVEALSIYRHDPGLRRRVMDAADQRGDAAFRREAEAAFEG